MKMKRWKFAAKVAAIHLLISFLLALCVSWLVFSFWYPYPYGALAGGLALFFILIGVDVVCGPLLSFILSNPQKQRKELILDLSLVVLIQLSALLYGLYSIEKARPVVVSFEGDRFAVVSKAQIDLDELAKAPAGLQQLPSHGVMKIGIRKAQNEQEFFESIELSGKGLEPSLRPAWWRRYSEVEADVKNKMLPLAGKEQQFPAELTAAIDKTKLKVDELFYLPLTSELSQNWIVLLDKNTQFVGYAPINGFDFAEKINKENK